MKTGGPGRVGVGGAGWGGGAVCCRPRDSRMLTPHKLETVRKDSSQRETSPVDTSISDFWSPELGENTFLLS